MTARPTAAGPALRIGGRELVALVALAFILTVTAVWWSLALWPLPETSPEWLARTREVCFGATRTGLPTAAGWLLLIGEPLGMIAALLIIWRDPLKEGLRALSRGWTGRSVLTAAAVSLVFGASAAGVRVARAERIAGGPPPGADAGFWRPLDLAVPDFKLVDQSGHWVTPERLRGHPQIIVFAYAHCQTICPRQVHDLLRARRDVGDSASGLLVITLDPWRDTPARLPQIAEEWALDDGARIVSGEVSEVTRVLDRWEVSRIRDAATGEITHAGPMFVLDQEGHLRYEVRGDAETAVRLARGL